MPVRLPTPREPECRHELYIVGFIEADFDEMVPGPQRAELVCRVRVAVQLEVLVEHSLVAVAKHLPRYRVSPGARRETTPCLHDGRDASVRGARPFRWPSESPTRCREGPEAISVVCIAAIPQPMSTPTAAGMMALRVGMTLPTVAPSPQCTSGIAASHQ